jgi:cell division septum initiation protein DivIVA
VKPRRTFLLVHVVVLCLVGGLSATVYAQDVFRQIDDLTEQLNALKREVTDLKDRVNALQRQLQQPPKRETQTPPTSAEPPKDQALGREKTKALACEPLKKFTSEADAALALTDPSAAQTKMDEAESALRAALNPYARYREIAQILGMASAVSWDVPSAVELRESPQGNKEFLEALASLKRRFASFCGKNERSR